MAATLVEFLEQVADLAAELAVEEANQIVDLLGSEPAFSTDLSPDQEALRSLPTWLVQRRDLGWWLDMITQHADNPINPPIKTLMRFSLRMQELHARYPAHAVLGMHPEHVAAYAQQIAPQPGIPQATPSPGIGVPLVQPPPFRGP